LAEYNYPAKNLNKLVATKNMICQAMPNKLAGVRQYPYTVAANIHATASSNKFSENL